MLVFLRRSALPILLGILLAACGGGGSSPAPATAPTPPPAPTPAPPSGPWQPASALLPASGNYVYTESDKDDYIGAGRSYLYTDNNALLSLTASGTGIKLAVGAVERWDGELTMPLALPALQVGYFPEVKGIGDKAAGGGLRWGGEGRSCNRATGWVAIDKVTIANNIVTELDFRFAQHCEGGAAAMRARVHWTLANANAVVPASPSAIPPGSWRAEPSALPASGSYVYLSGVQDMNGALHNRLYTRSNARMWLSSFGGNAHLDIKGDQRWSANFVAMDAVKRLQVGYYPNLKYFMMHNPLFGGLSWHGESPPCFGMAGWVIIDGVTYAGKEISELDMRFEQACAGGINTLRGQIRWREGETPVIVGPVNPPPAGLWQVPSTFVPPAGNYTYLSSETGFYVKPFNTVLPLASFNYESANRIPALATLAVAAGDYRARFVGIDGMAQLAPGYYPDLKDFALLNPLKGGFELTGNGTTCFQPQSWVVVDQATYLQGELASIDLRFETACAGSRDVMHGAIHWLKPPSVPGP